MRRPWEPRLSQLFAALILRACSAFFLLGSFLVATLALYRLFLHPLAAVPGPRLAAVSNAWHAYHARNGLMFELGTTLHARYGPVVRVGPNEVWLDSKEAFRTIYSEWAATHFPLPSLSLSLSLSL